MSIYQAELAKELETLRSLQEHILKEKISLQVTNPDYPTHTMLGLECEESTVRDRIDLIYEKLKEAE